MGFNLLSFLWLLITGAGISAIPPIIWLTRLASASLAFALGRLWEDRGFQILSVYFLLFVFRAFIPDPNSIFTEEMAQSILSALWLFASCYGMGRVLSIKQIKVLLFICGSIWTLGMAVLSCLGLYAVWSDQTIHLLEDAFINLYGRRLRIVYVVTVTGSFLSFSSLGAAIIGVCNRKRAVKTGFLMALFPIVVSLALTDSRSAYISVSVGFSSMVVIILLYLIQKNYKWWGRMKKWRKGALVFLVFVALAFVFVLCIMQVTKIYNQIKAQGIIAKAYADSIDDGAISVRGFTGSRILSGRAELWEEIIGFIRLNPTVMLIGNTKISPLTGADNYYAHCHNLYLQVLVESGAIGLILVLLFMIYTFVHVIRAIGSVEIPLWIKLLPSLILAFIVGDLVECFIWVRSSQCPMNAVFFISAGVLCSIKKTTLSKDRSLPK